MNPFSETLGLGVGTLRLKLVSRQLRGGGTVRGRVELELPEPLEAEGLTVTLRAEQRLAGVAMRRGRASLSTRKAPLLRVPLDLEGAGLFRSGGWDFALSVPERIVRPEEALGEGLAEVVAVIRAVQSPVQFPPEWFVEARLRRSWKVDLKQRLGIAVELSL